MNLFFPHGVTGVVAGSIVISLVGGCAHLNDSVEHLPKVDWPTFGEAGEPTMVPISGPQAAEVQGWWTVFGNQELAALVDEALTSAWTIQAAEARLRQAEATQRIARSSFLPQLSGSAGATVSGFSDGDREDFNSLGVDLTYELDAFGRLRAIQRRDDWLVRARAWDVEASRLEISVAVAQAWFDQVAETLFLKLAGEQEQAARDFLRLVQVRFEQGLTTEIDVLQQSVQVAEIRSVVPLAEARLRTAIFTLNALLGRAPGEVLPEPTLAFPQDVTDLPVATPLQLLLNRPDLRRLQAEVASAHFDEHRAWAERLPRLTVSADATWADGRGPAGILTNLAGGIVAPIFDFGRRAAEQERAEYVTEGRVAVFTQEFINAARDVETFVTLLDQQRLLIETLLERQALLERTLEQVRLRYQQGLTDYLPVLTTTQNLYALQQRTVRERRIYFGQLIQLYRTLGGPLPQVTRGSGAGGVLPLPEAERSGGAWMRQLER